MGKWKDPAGELREDGAATLTDAELLPIFISTDIRGKPVEKIAEEQLPSYVAILWPQESSRFAEHTPYLCIATDGVRFVTYWPIFADTRKESGVHPKEWRTD